MNSLFRNMKGLLKMTGVITNPNYPAMRKITLPFAYSPDSQTARTFSNSSQFPANGSDYTIATSRLAGKDRQ